jgi:hypothetical protein
VTAELFGNTNEEREMNFKSLILLGTLIALAGCTSIRPIDHEKVDLAKVLEAGDRVIAYEKQGRVVDMTLTRIDNGILFGSHTASGLQAVQVNIDDIEKIEAEKISGLKTTGAVLGGLVAIPVVAAGAVIVGAGAIAQ